ncbi:MAG: CRTAC1 family protein [Acidobacteriota bacterium]
MKSGVAGLFLLLLTSPSPAAEAGFQLVDTAAAAGLDASMICGMPGKPSILDGTGPGIAVLDYDGDGWVDLLLRSAGTTYDPGPVHEPDRLYRNLGDGTFIDVTERAGVGDRHFASGVTAADVDGDGDEDLFLSNYGANVFYRNRGDGTFEDATAAAGLEDDGWGTGTALADTDRDGDLDLYLVNYVVFDPMTTPRLGNPRCVFMGVQVFCGPRGLIPGQDRFYRNRGDGTFEEAAREVGLHRDEPYYGLGMLFSDIDDDGDADLYVADDATPNLLYLNEGDGTFVEEGLLLGVAFSQEGTEQAGMGVNSGDYNRDGRMDLLVTNFSHDTHSLYRNDGLLFEVATLEAGLGETTLPRLGWGTAFVDLDGDGWQDLFFSHGHVYPQMDGRGLGTAWDQPNAVFRNRGDGTFEEISASAGPGLQVVHSSRGAAVLDLENDGDPDLFVANMDLPPTLLRNDRNPGVSWLGVILRGQPANRDAVGARIRLGDDAGPQIREVHAGSSYLSREDLRQTFGLGAARTPREIEVRWPRGGRSRYRGLPPDRYYVVIEPAP